MRAIHFLAAIRQLVVFLHRPWYGSECTGADRRCNLLLPVRFDSIQVLIRIVDSALVVERTCSLKSWQIHGIWVT